VRLPPYDGPFFTYTIPSNLSVRLRLPFDKRTYAALGLDWPDEVAVDADGVAILESASPALPDALQLPATLPLRTD
jgi:hypothetical protein